MTAPRRARSAWLLVGSTAAWRGEVHSGPGLEQVARQPAGVAVAGLLARVGAQDRLELALQGADAALEICAVGGVLEDLPGPEQLVQIFRAASPKSLAAARPSACALKSRRRCCPADLAAAQREV